MKSKTRKIKHFSLRKGLCIPYGLFLLFFVIFPILLIIFYAFTDNSFHFSLEAAKSFFTTTSKLNVLFVSLFISLQTTIVCLIIGYPLAYFLANKKFNKNAVLITLFIAPMWINFVLRTSAMKQVMNWINLSCGEYPYLCTIIGMVYNYLPFVILPLYTTMLKLDKNQIEAASDLGANSFQVFVKNIIPQSFPGIISAIMMTFMPTMSSYVISDAMSERQITIIGTYINIDFSNSAYHDGSFLALIMLVLVGLTMLLSGNSKKQERSSDIW